MPLTSFLLKDSDLYLRAEQDRLIAVKGKNLEATEPEDMSWRPVLLGMCRSKVGLDANVQSSCGRLSCSGQDLRRIQIGRASKSAFRPAEGRLGDRI